MAGHFQNISLPDTLMIKQVSRDQLKLHLESLSGKKDLVLDGDLMKPLDRIAGANFLKEHGVDKIFKLESAKQLPGCDQRIYLVRPSMVAMKFIADQINADKNCNTKRRYKILMVPRKLYVCEHILEQEGVYGDVEIEELQIEFIPLDRDILSLEIPEFFRSFYLDGDQTWVHTIARSLVNLQQLFGLIPNTYGIGRCAKLTVASIASKHHQRLNYMSVLALKMVDKLMTTMFNLQGEPSQMHSKIGHMFLIDRDIDYVTPLCSQVTYEGLLDDTFGVTCGLIDFGPEVTGTNQTTKLLLTSEDKVYDEIRNRHISNVFGFLSATAKDLQQGYDKRHKLTSVGEMKDYVANDLRNLKQQHKSLTLHIGACECIMKTKTKGDFEDQLRAEHSLVEGVDIRENTSYVEEIINRQFPQDNTLRLLCLLSLTQGGLSQLTHKSLKTQFLHSYGFEHMLTFSNLKRLGLYTELENQSAASKSFGKFAEVANIAKNSPFRTLAKKLNLVPKSAEEFNLKNPNDMAYVFSGAYTPLLCKLVEQVLSREGFSGLDEVMKHIPHPAFCNKKAQSMKGKSGAGNPQSESCSKVVLVYFLGGCTFTEITALRFLGRLKGYKFIIATTSITNGARIIRNLSEKK